MHPSDFVIRQSGLGITLLDDPAGRKLSGGYGRFAIYDAARRELARETAEEIAPPELCKLAEWLSANISTSPDDKQIGIAETTDRASKNCHLSYQRFQQWNVPVANRGRYDLAFGLGQGEEVRPISLAVAERLAMGLAHCMNAFYRTKPVPEIETAAEKTAREKAASDAVKQAQYHALAEVEENKRRARRDAVVAEVAEVLADANGDSTQRAERLLTTLEHLYGLHVH